MTKFAVGVFIVKKYRCKICGREFSVSREEAERGNIACPVCFAPGELLSEIPSEEPAPEQERQNPDPLAYSPGLNESSAKVRGMAEIHRIAETGAPIIGAMGIRKTAPDWDDILILGAQLNPPPLESSETVDATTIIGKRAKKPMVIDNPVFVSHMSFGALSREAKMALAKGSAIARTATCSGEGGILKEEMDAAYRYIFEYVPNLYSVSAENLQNADAIEIKIGQGAKPGLGGHLPGAKVTGEIAAIRGKALGEDIHSPSKFSGLNTKEDLKGLVDKIRADSEGRPVGIKIAAGRIERDLEFCVYAKPDFITIDGRGGGTGASPKLVRNATSVPTVFALHRARKYLDSVQSDITLIITGGLRLSSDFAKAIAMGADAVATATAGLMALGCQQYRICGTGQCPMGIATQDPQLRQRLDVDKAARRVANYLNVTLQELRDFARLTGHSRLRDLSVDDLCTVNREISDFTDIKHA